MPPPQSLTLFSGIPALISCEYYLPVLFIVLTPLGLLFHMQPTGLKTDDVSLGIPLARLGLGRDMVPSFIFRTLSPICILSVVGRYPLPLLFLDLCIVSLALDSVSRCCIYVLLWVPSRTVVMLSQFHPHNVCVATCTLCLVGVL